MSEKAILYLEIVILCLVFCSRGLGDTRFGAQKIFPIAIDNRGWRMYHNCTSTVSTVHTEMMDAMIHLDYRDARPIYIQIVDGFRDQILAGVLQQGEKLPSVRELATQLTINPNTIQRAYRELEVQGWVATVPGKGCFICPRLPTETPQKQELLHTFDKTAQALLTLGMTPAELMARLEKGDTDHA